MTGKLPRISWWMRLLLLVAVAGSLSGPLVGPALAAANGSGSMTVKVVGGRTACDSDDPVSARQAAIAASQNLAVSAALTNLLSTEILAANFDQLSALSHGQPEQFIRNYEVMAVAEGTAGPLVLLRAEIDAGALRKSIKTAGILIDREQVPRILLLIRQVRPDQPPLLWWQKNGQRSVPVSALAMQQAFSRKGLKAVTPSAAALENVLLDVDLREEENQPAALNDQALALGDQMEADFVVIGRVEVKAPETGPVEADNLILSASARMLNVATRQAVVSEVSLAQRDWRDPEASDSEGPATAEDFLERAGRQLAQKLSPSVVMAWDEIKDTARPLTITVRGAGYIARLSQLRATLEAIDKVKQFRISQMTVDKALISVSFAGNAEQLALALRTQAAEKLTLNVTNVSAAGLTIDLQ